MASSPFGTFNGVEPFALFSGVGLHPIAGDQVFLGHVVYEAGTTVKRHSHEHTEQAMLVLDGSVTMTIGVGAVIMISRVAVRPSSRGIRMSIVTTSGRSR